MPQQELGALDRRDKHLKNSLHVAEHPEASLVVDRGSLKLPADNEVVESSAIGML